MKSKELIFVYYSDDDNNKMRFMFNDFSSFNNFLASHSDKLLSVKYSLFLVGDDYE